MLTKIGDLCGAARRTFAYPSPAGATTGPRDATRHSPGRSRRRIAARVAAAGVAAVAVVSMAACGSGSSSNSNSASSSSGAGSSSGANVTAAKAAIAPYVGQPSEFPVTEPLPQPLPAGKKFVFFQCSTPFCALAGKSLQAAVTAIGGTYTAVSSGATAQTSQAAASSVLALKPDVAFVSIDPSLFGDSLKKLSDAGIKVVSISIAKDVAPFGISFNYIGADALKKDGALLADWVVANHGAKANAVFYGLPTFDFSAPMQQAFETELKNKCSSCNARAVQIDVATIGTTAPRTMVADLQAHPDTNVAVFVSMQMAQGLPAAMQAAGLKGITTVGRGPTPQNLQDIKDGNLTAGLTIDAPVSTWTAVDAAARLLEGSQPTANEKAGELDQQFLGQKDITFDPTNGWSGYPDFAQRFAKLWHPAG